MRYKLAFFFIYLTGFTSLRAQENTVVNTDSSIVETSYHEAYNYILVNNKLKKSNKSYYKELYSDTKRIKETGMFLNGEYYGIRKEYWPTGKIKSIIDYTNGSILYYDKKAYPYLELQNTFKAQADNIIKRAYSEPFFNKHIVWDIGHSDIYNDTSSEDWIGKLSAKPTKFLLRYIIIYGGVRYSEIIEVELNSKGQLMKDGTTSGFETLPAGSPRDFSLTKANAVRLAKQKGLTETAASKANCFLVWEGPPSYNSQKGHFALFVAIRTTSIKDIHPKGRSTVIDKFDVYQFNPWTSVFIGKKKMKKVRGWEEMSGSITGMMPDN